MVQVMRGVRVVEVAEHTFVPAASGLLADWGADVIKIEHVERGDAMRGLRAMGAAPVPDSVHVAFEHANRGKRSLALDLSRPEGREVLDRLVSAADVLVTNKLPSVRARLGLDSERLRAKYPRLIYARGTGQGDRGPDRDRGAYDMLAFWARSGVASGAARDGRDVDRGGDGPGDGSGDGSGAGGGAVPGPPAPGFGDAIGALAVAGGVLGALFHRERTGEGSVVDVSLLGTGLWAMGHAVALASVADPAPGAGEPARTGWANPLVGNYRTADGRWLALCCLHAARDWPPLCAAIDRPDLAAEPRYAGPDGLLRNSAEVVAVLREVFAARPLAEWRERLADFPGPWSVVQDVAEAATDPQTVANGYLQEHATPEGVRYALAAPPIQFDGAPTASPPAPAFGADAEDVLTELGLDWDAIIALKLAGIVS